MLIFFFFAFAIANYAGNRSLYFIDVQVFGGKSMKHSCRCCLVPFRGFRPFSCTFYLEYHCAAVSEVSKVGPISAYRCSLPGT